MNVINIFFKYFTAFFVFKLNPTNKYISREYLMLFNSSVILRKCSIKSSLETTLKMSLAYLPKSFLAST